MKLGHLIIDRIPVINRLTSNIILSLSTALQFLTGSSHHLICIVCSTVRSRDRETG